MGDWQELVTLEQFAALMRTFALVLPTAGLVLGAAAGLARRNLRAGMVRGLALGLTGPLGYALWLLFAWTVRYDPMTGYCGLHRVSVLWLNVAIFAAVGVGLGLLCRRLWRPLSSPQDV